MLRKIILTGLLACLSLGWGLNLYAQENVYRAWGKSIGTAQTDRDFLIYDAVCVGDRLFIVGKAESGTDFELKQGENTYFHGKDSTTDAFLACMSLEGDLLWSTYLPALEDGYYNAFATTVEYTQYNTLLVIGNAYEIQGDLKSTKSAIPKCPGKIFVFEFDTFNQLIQSKIFSFKWFLGDKTETLSIPYPPRIIKSTKPQQTNPKSDYAIGGIVLSDYTEQVQSSHHRMIFHHSIGFYTNFSWQSDTIVYIAPREDVSMPVIVYSAAYPLTISVYTRIVLNFESRVFSLDSWASRSNKKITRDFYQYSRGIDLLNWIPIFEKWTMVGPINNGSYPLFQGKPRDIELSNSYPNKYIFPGTIQNIHTYQGKYIIQGINCRNYRNGFFKETEQEDYAYSHDTAYLIPKTKGFYQERNNAHSTVPYLLIYDSIALFGKPEETSVLKTPLWGSYLNADWYYEDFFHTTDSAQWKDIYQPYEPVLCSYGDFFFLIGNIKSIDHTLLNNYSTTNDFFHHQGVILSFRAGCPPETTAFQDVRFLCPDDSVELKPSPDYIGFKFRFDNASLSDGSIVLNADSSRAWAKKEGTFAAVLDGSSLGCPDVTVDTVRISFSPYPEPVSALNPDSTIAACAAASVVLNPVTETDTSFSYLWFDGDTVAPKTVRFSNDSLFFASVEVSGYCTSFRDSTQIRFLPPYVNLGKDSLLCTYQTFADTSLLLHLNARQDYFPDADWIFHWKINGVEASDSGSQPLRYADFKEAGIDRKTAVITIAVSLSDADADGCTANDTLVFSLVSLPEKTQLFLPPSDTLCAHQDLELILPDTAEAYRCFWLDQDSVLLPYGYDTTRYTVQGMRGLDGYGAGTDTREPRFFQLRLDHKLCGVSYFDTLLVYDQVKPNFELLCHDTLICLDEPVKMDSLSPHVYRPFYVFEWNDGKKGSDYVFTDSGVYVLRFFVGKDYAMCGYDTASDTIRVRWSDPAQTRITLSDTSFCEKLSVTLDARVPFDSTKYSWQDGPLPNPEEDFGDEEDSIVFTSPIKVIKETGTYTLSLLDTMGCVNRKQIEVTIEDCSPKLEIPNVFTPNGDGVNDVWKFKQLEKCVDVKVEVVDRWGQPVLKTKVATADDFEWNGTINNRGRRLPDGPYFYMVTYKDVYGKSKVQSGSITILGTSE